MRRILSSRNSGRKRNEAQPITDRTAERLAEIDRHRIEELAADVRALFGALCLEQRGLSRNRDGVAGRPDFQSRIDAGSLQELNLDSLQNELLEPWSLDAQFVAPCRQRGYRVITGLRCDRFIFRSCGDISYDYLGARYHGPIRVIDRAGDRPAIALS